MDVQTCFIPSWECVCLTLVGLDAGDQGFAGSEATGQVTLKMMQRCPG